MKTLKYSIYLLLFLATSCAGVSTLKIYKVRHHDKNYIEQVLTNLPYSSPEICVPKVEDSFFIYEDENFRRIEASNDTIRLSNTIKNYYEFRNHRASADSAFFNQKIKVYYRDQFGSKIFIYAADSGKILYELQILDNNVEKQKCIIGIIKIFITTANKRQWFGYYQRDYPQVVTAIKIFEETILPKMEKEVGKNGIDVAQMDATLLKKVEELTLYLIEQNKRIELLEKQNAEFNKIK